MSAKDLSIIILAAGMGTRMQSSLPKVMHPLAHKPLINHVIDTAAQLKPKKIIVVVGPDMPALENAVKPHTTVIQTNRLGTGDALKQALPALKNFKGTVMVLYGDTPLIQAPTLKALHKRHLAKDNPAVTVLGMTPPDPYGYGRLILKSGDILDRIVEQKDANASEAAVTLCNTGLYCIDGKGIQDWAAKITNKNAQKEYYITDLPQIAAKDKRLTAVIHCDYEQVLGVNTRAQLAELEMIFQNEKRATFMEKGVTMQDPSTVYFAADTKIASDVTIEPNVFFGAGVAISKGCHIKAFSHIEGANIAQNVTIGPFARIRPDTQIGENAKIGNFVEIKKSKIGKGSKINHLAYVGDTQMGKDVNFGCGGITANYDGNKKSQTTIEDGVMIGSNATLIAPVKIEKEAFIAAGSTITKKVSKDALGIARARQSEKKGWAKTHCAKKK
ncbi:MAG: bifunctional N-acetylglucosamine-1-phosphate uridyltransferase/glucosamine-1-phosphate acetyltransferase [Micavibrio sp.]|nr:bifunctional N-acetylglucosamine-1-phosphate uridyltransferase/glucosamine-1-phosphate acetyltransferase [Micavibrio sp.]|tara:strand:- start:5366 stop:6697 length:1332 start_codon:yes stop_codon:yes gene_type:complete